MKTVGLAAFLILMVFSPNTTPRRPTLRELNPLIDPVWRKAFLSRFDNAIKTFEEELSARLKKTEIYLERGESGSVPGPFIKWGLEPWSEVFCCRAHEARNSAPRFPANGAVFVTRGAYSYAASPALGRER
jgi:hypothetical protein